MGPSQIRLFWKEEIEFIHEVTGCRAPYESQDRVVGLYAHGYSEGRSHNCIVIAGASSSKDVSHQHKEREGSTILRVKSTLQVK